MVDSTDTREEIEDTPEEDELMNRAVVIHSGNTYAVDTTLQQLRADIRASCETCPCQSLRSYIAHAGYGYNQ